MTWFKEWPENRLAKICSGDDEGQRPFARWIYQ